MANITYGDMLDLLKEIENGVQDKSRTLNSISNSKLKNILLSEANMALKTGITTSILAAGTGVATSALVGTIGGVGTGVVASGLTTLGVASFSVAAGAATGAAAGSVVPIAGTIIGGVIGVAAGAFVGSRMEQKNKEQKEELRQEVVKKQNRIIRELEKELNELKSLHGNANALENMDRYKYLLSSLFTIEEFKKYFNLGGDECAPV
ncbi:MAG: hypothetical protein HXM71_04895 [Mogibacterium diversum]|uniref:Glycine zipper domain-containing protein n=1 Tax=Mogibacterium diversum TaxID=114527 RepID=A0A930EEA3_9FIRM|nr:hypothetical protein [Mogibacterium diversum]